MKRPFDEWLSAQRHRKDSIGTFARSHHGMRPKHDILSEHSGRPYTRESEDWQEALNAIGYAWREWEMSFGLIADSAFEAAFSEYLQAEHLDVLLQLATEYAIALLRGSDTDLFDRLRHSFKRAANASK